MNIKKKLQYISIISFTLCLLFLLVYHYGTKQTTDLDIVSHFFGGLTTSSIVSLVALNFPQLSDYKFESLVLVVVMFEFFEYLFLVYLFPEFEFVPTVTQPFDTITDIMAGLFGGSILIYWEVKKWKQKKV